MLPKDHDFPAVVKYEIKSLVIKEEVKTFGVENEIMLLYSFLLLCTVYTFLWIHLSSISLFYKCFLYKSATSNIVSSCIWIIIYISEIRPGYQYFNYNQKFLIAIKFFWLTSKILWCIQQFFRVIKIHKRRSRECWKKIFHIHHGSLLMKKRLEQFLFCQQKIIYE